MTRSKQAKFRRAATRATSASVLASAALGASAQAQSSDALINVLVKKGILTEQEAQSVKAEAEDTQTNLVSASKWKISNAIKDIGLFGDLRFRYEYRGVETVDNQLGYRQRFRYALRAGIKGDLFDDFYYGIRLETASNPRSPWVTFGDETSYPFPGPFSKTNDGLGIGQVFLGWRAADWLELTVGKMPNPMYTTALIWDTDINPEGAAERFKHSFGNLDLFATFGQFLYQDTNPDQGIPTIPSFMGSALNQSDVFLLAWQVGAELKFNHDLALKIAPTLYNYTGHGQSAGFPGPFVGEGGPGGQNFYDPSKPSWINQSGINNLLVFDVPGELNFKIGKYRARLFGDFAVNLDGAARAQAAYLASQTLATPLLRAYPDDNKAYQAGFAFGNLGLVYGTTSKKHTWEARTYWQHTEQYAVDVNLNDSDFFEGRGNLQGIYTAFAYSITDGIIGTVRYGFAEKINPHLGTGGSNQDMPQINPVNFYNLVQLDLTWRF